MKEKWLTFHWSILSKQVVCIMKSERRKILQIMQNILKYMREMNNVTKHNIFKANTQVDHAKILRKRMQCTWNTKTQNTHKKLEQNVKFSDIVNFEDVKFKVKMGLE
jgi:predicted transcriptional regulator